MKQFLICYRRNGLSVQQLWVLVVLAGVAFYVSLVPLPPNDFWWHLKIGEIIFTTRKIPRTNMFAWTLAEDQAFTYGAWFGEYLFYLLYRWGGLALVTFSRNVMVLLTHVLVGYEAKRRTRSWYLAALAVFLTYLMTLNNLIVRPQNWSWLPFMVFLIALSKYADKDLKHKWLLLCPVVMIFWVNVHGAFVLGIVLLGMFCVGESLRYLLHLPDALSRRDIVWLGVIALLTIGATLVNPQGVGIFTYVTNLMMDRPSQSLIVEWQPPTPEGAANIVFYVCVLLLMVVLWYAQYRPRPTELLLLLGFLWLAWSGIRYVMWFGLIVTPILVAAISTVFKPGWLFAASNKNLLNGVLAVLIFAPVIFVQPWFLDLASLPLPAAYMTRVSVDTDVGPLVAADTPVAVTEYLRAYPGGRLFHEMGYGSYFIWAIPEQGVFIDPRVELYPYVQWQDYMRIIHGVQYNRRLDKYHVDRLALDLERQRDLIESLRDDAGWQLVYEDARSQVWAKCPGAFCERDF